MTQDSGTSPDGPGSQDPALPDSQSTSRIFLVTVLFCLLTLALTYPLVLRPGSTVTSTGDPLLNAWILAWQAHKLSRGEFSDYFDANIFYPHSRTLTYSEPLFPQAVLAAPINVLTGNPILAYNVVLLAAFATSALGMFLLAHHHTRSIYGSLLAGIGFAFSPFMFDHLPHLQIVSAGGIPATFLFLDRLLRTGRWRDAFVAGGCLLLQALANGYYALFLVFAVPLFLGVEMLRRRRLPDLALWFRLVSIGVLALACTSPFLIQYRRMQQEMHFVRPVGIAATPASFLAAPASNRLWGGLTREFGGRERRLFPGLTLMGLAFAGLLFVRRRDERSATTGRETWSTAAVRLAPWIVRGTIAGAITLAVTFTLTAAKSGPTRAEQEHFLWLALVALAGCVLLTHVEGKRTEQTERTGIGIPAGYLAIGVMAFLFSFGLSGPFALLREYVPGYGAIRAVTRFHVLTSMVLALLAAQGARLVEELRRGTLRAAAMGVVAAMLLAEYVSVPLRVFEAPIGDRLPTVYRWLASHGDEGEAILELPLPSPGEKRARGESIARIEGPRLLASTQHWKRLLNGFSGFIPSSYMNRCVAWRSADLRPALFDAVAAGACYIIVHDTKVQGLRGRKILASLLRHRTLVELVATFEDAWLLRLRQAAPHCGASR